MTFAKRIFAAVLAACMMLTLAACHQKDEVVMTIDGVEISSGLYLMYMMNATDQFRSGIDEGLKEGEKAPEDLAGYLKLKLDDKDAITWIREKAEDNCREHAWVENTFAKNKLKLGDYAASVDQYVSMYWDSYGYGAYYEANGVSRSTFTKYYETLFKEQVVFEYFYGEKGPEAVSADTIKTTFIEKYLLIEYFTASLTDDDSKDLAAAKITEIKKSLDALVEKINDGEMTVKEAGEKFEEEQKKNDTSSSTSSGTSSGASSAGSSAADSSAASTGSAATSSGVTSSEEKNPAVYPDAVVVTADDTSGMYALLKDVKERDKAAVYKDDTNKQYIVALLRDPAKDYEHYKDDYRLTVLHDLKDEAFEKKLETEIAKLKADIDESLVKYYSPKKIKES